MYVGADGDVSAFRESDGGLCEVVGSGWGSWLRANEAGRIGLEPYSWYFSATYDAVYTVLETSGEQLAETNFRFEAERESGTPGMPGWGEVGGFKG